MTRERMDGTRTGITVALLAVVAMGPSGCKDGVFDWSFMFERKSETVVDSSDYLDPLFSSSAYRDTIAEQAFFDGLRRMRVSGYGIVVGLGRNGSSHCPRGIRSLLIQEMYKTRKFAERRGLYVSPEELIDSEDTAVVLVEGEIPAAGVAGERFDLQVRAVPGTQVGSLEGGWLYPCNLSIHKSKSSGGGAIQGKSLAVGGGPIFLNPFGRTAGAATRASLLEGTVIGGGKSNEARRIRLLLTTPSYHRAITMARCINERFGRSTRLVADAVSPSEIRIKVPPDHAHDPRHFLAVVQHLYLPASRPGFVSNRVRELAREFVAPDAPHAEIAGAWEAIGRASLEVVREFYADSREACRFYSAVAGLRLGDDDAVQVIEQHLTDVDGSYRMAAIKTLGMARNSLRAARPLRRAVNDSDPRIRVAAYEALIGRDDPSITRKQIGGAFGLDIVSSEGAPLIYVKRSNNPRIALFGGAIRARPPLFFGLPDNSLIIDADPDAERLTLVRRSPVNGDVSAPIESDLSVANLIALIGGTPPEDEHETVRGLGIDYSSVVLLLSELCESDGIDARLLIENPAFTTMARARALTGRPES